MYTVAEGGAGAVTRYPVATDDDTAVTVVVGLVGYSYTVVGGRADGGVRGGGKADVGAESADVGDWASVLVASVGDVGTVSEWVDKVVEV